MPCYEVREVCVEFKLENVRLIVKVLNKLGYKVMVNQEAGRIAFGKYTATHTIDLKSQQVSAYGISERSLTNTTNEIKKTYAIQAISDEAQKRRWALSKQGNKLQLKRY